MNRPLPWLRYVDASSLNDDVVDFDGLNVESPTGEHLGDVEGFIVDTNSSRPYYVVVDAGGWFKSKHFLLPVGHTRFDPDEEVQGGACTCRLGRLSSPLPWTLALGLAVLALGRRRYR